MSHESIYFDPGTFRWAVHTAGYRWMDPAKAGIAGRGTSPVLTAVLTPDRSCLAVRQSFPLAEQPALFRVFAGTDPTEEGILQFANTYGSLTTASAQTCIDPGQPELVLAPTLDTYAGCRENVLAMRRAVGLWKLIQKKDIKELARHIRWQQDAGAPAVHYDSHPSLPPNRRASRREERVQVVIASPQLYPDLFEQCSPGDVVLPAFFYIRQLINARLKGHVTVQMAWDTKQLRLALQLFPDSLLAGLWLQFGEAVSADKRFRRCKECGKWFELSPETARMSRFFCSNACRSKAYRQRKEAARRLRDEGKSFKEIAAELGTDVATVKKWVSDRKE